MSDREELLSILEEQGRQFLDSFSLPESRNKKRKRDVKDIETGKKKSAKVIEEPVEDWEEEWLGVGHQVQGSDKSEHTEDGDVDEGPYFQTLDVWSYSCTI